MELQQQTPVPSLLLYSGSLFSQRLLFIGYKQRYSQQRYGSPLTVQRHGNGTKEVQTHKSVVSCALRKTEADFSIQGRDRLPVEITQYSSFLFFFQLLFNIG